VNAEQIRDAAIEVLAQAQRAADLRHYPQRGDGAPRDDWESLSEWMRNQYLDAAVPFVDALATAGLLPTGEQRPPAGYLVGWEEDQLYLALDETDLQFGEPQAFATLGEAQQFVAECSPEDPDTTFRVYELREAQS
jgi:hypothetical protein